SFEPAGLRLEETLIGVAVHLRDCVTAGEPGSPALPKQNVRLALPPRTRMTGVDVRTLAALPLSSGVVPVAPLQPTRPGAGQDVEPFPIPPFVPADPVLYEEALRRPPARLVEASVEGFNPVVSIDLNPVRLRPDARLELQSEIEVIVRHERDDTF